MMRTAAATFKGGIGLFGSLDGGFAELLEIVHEGEGGLAGAGTGSFVPLYYLGIGIDYEFLILGLDFLNKFFHD